MSLQSYHITAEIRAELAQPLGTLIPDSEVSRESLRRYLDRATLVVSVGDRTTERVAELGFTPQLEIIDLKEQRIPKSIPTLSRSKRKIVNAINQPGSITVMALRKIRNILEHIEDSGRMFRLVVDGEEDLLVLPIAAFFPKGTAVLYGQPNVGMVVVSTNKSREKARKILSRIGIRSLRNY